LRLALAQLNPVVGDIAGNREMLAKAIEAACAHGADLFVSAELAVTGYPPEDLLHKRHFLAEAAEAVATLAPLSRETMCIVGFPEADGDHVYNAAAILAGGEHVATYHKVHLPNYGVFDEHRYFEHGSRPAVVDVGAVRVGISICEDIWLAGPPASAEAQAGARLIVNLSASPWQQGKGDFREEMLRERCAETGCAIAFCGQVGGQDELVFDGHSLVLDADGELVARAAQFDPQLLLCDIEPGATEDADPHAADLLASWEPPDTRAREALAASIAPILSDDEAVYRALVLGTRDYANKNGFPGVVLGLSGGVDSALVACVAVDALGPERVACVTMPSQYTSSGTYDDAHALAAALRVDLVELPIGDVFDGYMERLGSLFRGYEPDVTEENLQARIRGNYLMAISNKFGSLVLTTGNKSEMAVGYSTLYGDSAGGFAVIKDVPKTLVYRLCELRNRQPDSPIPETILTRAPSAELRPGQSDQDSLPPYNVLDPLIEGYVERDQGVEELVAAGFDRATVERVTGLVDRAEYKRRQQPPGVKVTGKAFGRDRRMPITSRYRG
jgi:NAD+ synthase (glutamine-hydrolysing)